MTKDKGGGGKTEEEDEIQKIIWKANNGWIEYKFQLLWKDLEWVDPRTHNLKTNPFCTSTYKFYIKENNPLSHFVVHYNINLVGYNTFFNINNSTVQYLHYKKFLEGIKWRIKPQQSGTTWSIKAMIHFSNKNNTRCQTVKTLSTPKVMNK